MLQFLEVLSRETQLLNVDRRPLAASPQVELAGMLRFDYFHDLRSDKHSITLFSGDFPQNPLWINLSMFNCAERWVTFKSFDA